ncbi:MAG: hypothetical protein ACLQF1_16215 [Methyloceanibacter sp.]
MSLIKSKKRVADHGEVFTPPWMVEAMLDLVATSVSTSSSIHPPSLPKVAACHAMANLLAERHNTNPSPSAR